MVGGFATIEGIKVGFIPAMNLQNLTFWYLVAADGGKEHTESPLRRDALSMRSSQMFGLHSSVLVKVLPTLVLFSSHPSNICSH